MGLKGLQKGMRNGGCGPTNNIDKYIGSQGAGHGPIGKGGKEIMV